jgi:hypothetical protein
MNVATVRKVTPHGIDRSGNRYEGKPYWVRSVICHIHAKRCSSFCGGTKKDDGTELWFFWCSGAQAVSNTGQVIAPPAGHYFAAMAPSYA